MDLIYEIYKKLSKQEIRTLKQQFKEATFEYEKVGKLFTLVTQSELKEENFYAQSLYGKNVDNTFRVTKSRLKRMLENLLLNDKSLDDYATPIINVSLQVRKKLLQSDILLGRGAVNAGKQLLSQCILTAEKHHLFYEKFQAELLLYRHNNLQQKSKDYLENKYSLLEQNRQNAALQEALILHYAAANQLLNQDLSSEGQTLIREDIDKIQQIATQYPHPQSLHAWYLSEIYYHQVLGEFSTAFDFCRKYQQLTQEHSDYYSKPRQANAYIQLAQVALQIEHLEEAKTQALAALSLFQPDEMNALVTRELLFRIAFHGKNYEEAKEQIRLAFEHPHFNKSKILSAHWHYFQSCMLFQEGKYKEAYQELGNTSALLSDKFGRNVQVRLLEMMILFEMNSFEPLDAKIQNIRQFIRRAHQDSDPYRYTVLLKILREWYRCGYDLPSTWKNIQVHLKKLAEFHEKRAFQITGFELIRLEQWMEGKIKK